eukprot:11611437-Ditylum_brightwellii.AAC.1
MLVIANLKEGAIVKEESSYLIKENSEEHVKIGEREESGDKYLKAVKADDATVDESLWNQQAERYQGGREKEPWCKALDTMRKFILFCYRKNTTCGLTEHLHSTYGKHWLGLLPEVHRQKQSGKRKWSNHLPSSYVLYKLKRDLMVGRDVVLHSCQALDGSPAFIINKLLPSYWKHPKLPRKGQKHNLLKKKICKVVDRRYIKKGEARSLTGYFDVPKGTDDIRVVYHAKECGLNRALWAPKFGLPTTGTAARAVDSHSWFANQYMGEMFHNYWLDTKLRPYTGVDLAILSDNQGVNMKQGRWARLMMGMTQSPFSS